jgi:hypothetical protein
VLEVPSSCGVISYYATPEEVMIFAEAPAAIYAQAHGVTPSDCRAWIDAGGKRQVRCHHQTRQAMPQYCEGLRPG